MFEDRPDGPASTGHERTLDAACAMAVIASRTRRHGEYSMPSPTARDWQRLRRILRQKSADAITATAKMNCAQDAHGAYVVFWSDLRALVALPEKLHVVQRLKLGGMQLDTS
jgi:hypothetical protein